MAGMPVNATLSAVASHIIVTKAMNLLESVQLTASKTVHGRQRSFLYAFVSSQISCFFLVFDFYPTLFHQKRKQSNDKRERERYAHT